MTIETHDAHGQFAAAGLGDVFDASVADAEAVITLAVERRTVLAPRSAIDTLIGIRVEPREEPIALWRADRPIDFWDQPMVERYAEHLDGLVGSGHFLQRRVMVYDDEDLGLAETGNVLAPDHIFFALKRAHSPGTFMRCSARALSQYEKLAPFVYGLTYYPNRRFVVIPIPNADDLRGKDLDPDALGAFLAAHDGYDASREPMRALVSFDDAFVSAIGRDLSRLLEDPAIEPVA